MRTGFRILLIISGLVIAFSISGQSTFKNPIITGMNPDPSICRAGDDYYLVTSTFEYFPGLPIYQSKDLVNWKLIGHALSRPENCPLMGCNSGNGGNYAPTIRYHDGTFYVACTNYGGQGSQGQFYVTATDPAGPWSDPIWVGNWYVDPSMSFVNDTMYYLTPNNNDGYLLGVMDPATGSYIEPLTMIAYGTGGSSPEGPHMYKINDYYYLMAAEGGTGYQHMEVIQRSTSPWGPYEESPINPVLSNRDVPEHPFQAIGHADLIQLPDESWWAVCLGIRPVEGNYHHLGRETFLAPITWNEDGWPKVGTDGVVREEFTVPNLPAQPWDEEPVRDDFDTEVLGLEWNFIRNPHDADWSLTERPGFLRLNGSGISFTEKNSPAFIGRRQSAFRMAASAKLSFEPTADNEEAGLVVRGDDMNHYDLLVTMFAGERVVMLRQYLQGNVVSLNYKEITDGDIILRVTANELYYSFWVQEEEKTAVLIDSAATRNLSTERISGFTGTFIGMHASGNGTANVNPADFDWFDYESEPTVPYDWSIGPSDSLNGMVSPRILTITAPSWDQATITWENIANESGYTIEKYADGSFDSIGSTIADDTVFTDSGLEGNTLHLYRVKAGNELGYSFPSVSRSVLTPPEPGPFLGSPCQIPGKIEAENYDYGEANVAWYDTDEGNNGGAYRSDDVDIEQCYDDGGGYNIGWINSGEWLTYTVDIANSPVDAEFRIASDYGGGITLELDGTEIVQTSISSTGGWEEWQTLTVPDVELEAGSDKQLKVIFTAAGYNLNWIRFTEAESEVAEIMDDQSISIFPNPATDYFGINSKQENISGVEVFSTTGVLMNTIRSHSYSRIDISDFDVGIYFVRVHTESDRIRILKLIKG